MDGFSRMKISPWQFCPSRVVIFWQVANLLKSLGGKEILGFA